MVFHLTEIALGPRSASSTHKAFSYTDFKNPGPKTLSTSSAHPITRREVGSSSSTFLEYICVHWRLFAAESSPCSPYSIFSDGYSLPPRQSPPVTVNRATELFDSMGRHGSLGLRVRWRDEGGLSRWNQGTISRYRGFIGEASIGASFLRPISPTPLPPGGAYGHRWIGWRSQVCAKTSSGGEGISVAGMEPGPRDAG